MKLNIFQVGIDRPGKAVLLAKSTVKDMAMSSSDKTVAVAFGGTIELYSISDQEPLTLKALREVNVSGPSKPPESQILRFSSADDTVVVLTLHADHACNISLDAYDLEGRSEMKRSGDGSLKILNVR